MLRKDNEITAAESLEVLEHIHPQVLPIIAAANNIFSEGFQSGSAMMWKPGEQLSTAALTETDLRLDSLLREKLSSTFPKMGIITEEQEIGTQLEDTWIIDPLDGTGNFGKKIPIAGISLALWRKGRPIYGILSFPLENEVVYAAAKGGAYYNGEKLSTEASELPPHIKLLFTGIGTNDDKLRAVRKMSQAGPFPTDYLSAAFHFKTLVLRRAECGVFINLPVWDFAAGLVIAEESGLATAFIDTADISNEPENLREIRRTLIVGQKEIAAKIGEGLQT